MATTIRINNNLTTDKPNRIYSNLQDANDDIATKAGDTLLVDGSIKNYVALNCNKRLVIIGPGYFLTQNISQANTVSATVQGISFKSGSEGAIIIGLVFAVGSTDYKPYVYVNGISVIRCYISNGLSLSGQIMGLIILPNI
ncbi:MAG: hypothetical protein EOP43_04915 [Sphingobacteriaceae bacterium]|nr:MAG: hypothetical protein EOP43_04915 [Sphingobacteriaceae bacterium]